MSLSNEQLAIQIQLREDLQHTPFSVVEHCARLTLMWQSEKEKKEELLAALQILIPRIVGELGESHPERIAVEAAIAKATGRESI